MVSEWSTQSLVQSRVLLGHDRRHIDRVRMASGLLREYKLSILHDWLSSRCQERILQFPWLVILNTVELPGEVSADHDLREIFEKILDSHTEDTIILPVNMHETRMTRICSHVFIGSLELNL